MSPGSQFIWMLVGPAAQGTSEHLIGTSQSNERGLQIVWMFRCPMVVIWMFRCPVGIWMFRCPVGIWMFRCSVVLMDVQVSRGYMDVTLESSHLFNYVLPQE